MRVVTFVMTAWLAASGAALAAVDARSSGNGDGGAQVTDPEAPTVTARVDRATAHVGDAIALTLTAVSRAGLPVNLPNTIDLGPFAILDRKEAEQDLGDARVRREFTLTVAAYEPGDLEVPPIEVTYLGKGGDVRSARTAPVAVKIASLIANEPEPALKDNAPPVPVLQQDLLLVIIAGGVLAAALGALLTWLLVRRLRGRPVVRPGPPPRPAHEIALERLDRLGAYGFLENADNRPFYFAVSEVLRDYFGARFGFDSLEMTTDELLQTLRRRVPREPALPEQALVEIDAWLSGCDLVKFAKISPTAAESRGTLETAIRIVTSTRARPPGLPGQPTAPAAAEARRV